MSSRQRLLLKSAAGAGTWASDFSLHNTRAPPRARPSLRTLRSLPASPIGNAQTRSGQSSHGSRGKQRNLPSHKSSQRYAGRANDDDDDAATTMTRNPSQMFVPKDFSVFQ
jgi:hypothetical protein